MITILIVVVELVLQQDKISIIMHYQNLSGTDWFVYGYLMAVLLSYAFTAYKEALWERKAGIWD